MNINQLEAVIELHKESWKHNILTATKLRSRADEYESQARISLKMLLDSLDEREARLERFIKFCNNEKI